MKKKKIRDGINKMDENEKKGKTLTYRFEEFPNET